MVYLCKSLKINVKKTNERMLNVTMLQNINIKQV